MVSGLPSGLGGQLGVGVESSYGTVATATRFLEFRSEGLKADVAHVQSFGIGRGRVLRTSRNKSYIKGVAGPIVLPVMSKGFGLIFKHMLGSLSVAQQAATSEYLHTGTLDLSTGHVGLYLTTQIGRPDVGGTIRPFNYLGCKIKSWELKADLDQPLLLTLDVDGQTEQTSTALASASFASSDFPLYFTDGVGTIAGSSVAFRSVSVKGDNGFQTDRRFIGNTKKEPLPAAEATIMVALDFEFEDLTRHGQLTAGTEVSNIILTFDSSQVIASGNGGNYKLIVTIPKVILMDGAPNVGGPDVVREPANWKGLYDGTNNPVKFEYSTTDTAA